jgi:anti-sigma regulatory factor (Ser/Thr protein kinase)
MTDTPEQRGRAGRDRTTGTPPSLSADSVWSSSVVALADLSDARHAVSAVLSSRSVDDEVAHDVVLALTELAVNAFSHGDADGVLLGVDVRADGTVVLSVWHHDRGASIISDPPVMASPTATSGRGRAMVAAFADAFDTRQHADGTVEHFVTFGPRSSSRR